MQTTEHISDVRTAVRNARQSGNRIGCVPTMGALHAGHMSLVEECRQRAEFVCVTIFVNPTQFAPTEDLAKYPRPIEADLQKCRDAGVDLVFMPVVPSLYPDGYQTWVTVDEVTQPLEGTHRPSHFRGVTTVVAKLLNILQPDVACFGMKDYQQLAVIRRMVTDLDMPVDIIACATVREPDGLALSSRNMYLSAEERTAGLSLSQSLFVVRDALRDGATDIAALELQMKTHMQQANVEVQYAVIVDPHTLLPISAPQQHMVALIAAKVGATRLIDNVEIFLD
ncbi:MAG: pantoate--beta-alanine ligase [Planctomycetaceae bacterium]|nr:pantoate--beta-alanine ligase [Planctomycetaceae bacterium]MCB9951894.1 pantoate--beta-alanine ligase [Planctomycetaceae bacterium]